MAVGKVIYGTTVLVDLTADTVTASDLASGVTAHGADGEAISGTAPTVYSGTSDPSSSLGVNGDIYLKMEA